MATLPSFEKLGLREPSPQAGAVGYRATSGLEEAPSEAAAKFGETVQRIAFEQQDSLNATRAEDAWNAYKNAAMDLSVGADGFATKKAGDAVKGSLFKTYTGNLGQARKLVEATLEDDDVRQRFNQRANVTDLQFKDALLRHYTTERDAYEKQTFDGSMATAQALVAADPMNQANFDTALLNVERRAADLAAHQGITDKGALDKIKGNVRDALITKRIDALLYSNPIAADQLFRLTQDQIQSPETRLLLQHKTREASVTMNAGILADKDVNDTIASLMKHPRATPEGGPDTGSMTDAGERIPKSVRQNNPGNIVDVKTGEIRTFATPAEGAAALEGEIKLKLSGSSPAYKSRFGTQPVTPERLAETWAPAGAPGNSAVSTTNYANAIAMAVGIKPGDPIPNTPQAVAAVKQAITAFEAGAYAGGAQKASISTAAQYQTNETPNARDVAAQLPILLAKAQKRADEQYGADPTNPDRFAFLARYEAAIKSQLGSKVAQLTQIQKDYLDDVSDFVQGLSPQAGMQGGAQPAGGGRAGGPGMMRVTSIPMLQAANPQMFQKFQRLDAAGKQHVAVLMEQAQRADERGTPALYNEYRHRINLPPDHPDKVNWIQTISQDPRVVAGGLSTAQWSSLRTELKESATDEGRSQSAAVQSGTRYVRNSILGDGIFTNMGTAKDKAEYAIELWQHNADKVIGQYKAANKDIRPLFDPTPGAKESLITPEAIRPFKEQAGGAMTSAQALKQMAEKAATGTKPPPTITSDAEYDALPPGSTFIDPTGKARQKPGTAPAAPGYGARADGTQKGTGYFGALPAAGGKVSTEISVGVNIGGKEMEIPTLVPTLTRPEIDHLLAGQPPTKEIVDKAVAHAKTRIAAGKDPFAGPGDQIQPPAPLPTMNEQGKIVPPPEQPAQPVAEDDVMPTRITQRTGKQVVSGQEQAARAAAMTLLKKIVPSKETVMDIAKSTAFWMATQGGGPFAQMLIQGAGMRGEELAQALPTERELVTTVFRNLLKAGYSDSDEGVIKKALEYGDLTPAEAKKAKYMLDEIERDPLPTTKKPKAQKVSRSPMSTLGVRG